MVADKNSRKNLIDAQHEFAALLAESLAKDDVFEGQVVKGKVVGIEKDLAIIDVGLKMEGRVALKEFGLGGKPANLKIGDTVEVYLERVENALGEAVLSRDKARREESWTRLERQHEKGEKVTGVIFNKVKGGFTVDLDGAVAFLPGSQVDIRPVRDIGTLMHQKLPFQILKMDRRRGNIVVSRRSVLQETRTEQRADIVSRLAEGQAVDGLVKNITDYGAFIDLGGIDGLLHVTDMAWRRVNHPSEILNVGDTVKVQIIRINPETQRISLGMKQLQSDPWSAIEAKYPVGAKLKGTVTNIADYGAFVELEPGVEGLIHVSEMSWTKKNVHPGKIVSTSQQVDVQVLEVDPTKRRISLGLKQTQDNPWDAFLAAHPKGTIVEGPIRNITEFGLFIGLDNGIDGMVHLSDLDWSKPGDELIKEFKKGDNVKAMVLDVDSSKERISLGIKQLAGDPADTLSRYKKGDTVTCEVVAVQENGIEVKIADSDITAFVKRSDLSRDRSEQRPERFTVGQKVDAAVISSDKAARRITVSIKALEIAEEKQAVAQYGSSDSGASLGDIFKAAFKKRRSIAELEDVDAEFLTSHDLAEFDLDDMTGGEISRMQSHAAQKSSQLRKRVSPQSHLVLDADLSKNDELRSEAANLVSSMSRDLSIHNDDLKQLDTVIGKAEVAAKEFFPRRSGQAFNALLLSSLLELEKAAGAEAALKAVQNLLRRVADKSACRLDQFFMIGSGRIAENAGQFLFAGSLYLRAMSVAIEAEDWVSAAWAHSGFNRVQSHGSIGGEKAAYD